MHNKKEKRGEKILVLSEMQYTSGQCLTILKYNISEFNVH